MNSFSPSWQGTFRHWVKGHPYTAAGAVTLIVLAVFFCRRQQSEWHDVYLPAAARLSAGQDMYRPQDGYLYPPFMAWMTLPFLAVPASLARFAWFVINGVCLIAMLRWGWRLAGGNQLEGSHTAKRSEHLAALLGGLCGFFYLQNCLAHQQTDIVIGAALVGGCLLLVREKPLLAATSLGLAAACKCTALLWAPYLLWRGRPLAAMWLLIVALGVNLLPDLTSAMPAGRPWLVEYVVRYLKPLTDSNHYVGSWGSDAVYNQSLAGAGQRWCTTSWTWTATDCTIQSEKPLAPPQLLRACVYGLQAMLLLAVLWNCGRPFRTIVEDVDGRHQALECGIVLLLMLLLSPMSSKAHFGTLVVPGFCLARKAVLTRNRLLGSVLLAAILLGILCNKDPLGERLYTLSLWYGVVTGQALLLLVGCLIVFRLSAVGDRLSAKTTRDDTPSQWRMAESRKPKAKGRFTPAWVQKDACRASA